MRRWLPVLVLFAGLGIAFSFSQAANPATAFDRYISRTKSRVPEAAVKRFAAQCGVNLESAKPRYAVTPGGNWTVYADLAKGVRNVEADFFQTAEVWSAGRKTLVEMWWLDFEAGEQDRRLYCIDDGEILNGEQVVWEISGGENEGTAPISWAYEVRWRTEYHKFVKSTYESFVSDYERPVQKPGLGEDAPKTFGLIPQVFSWKDLGLPPSLLR